MAKCASAIHSNISPLVVCAGLWLTADRLDIVAKKHAGGRGQAFVVFAEQAAATAAMRALSGELFYGKELVSVR